VTYFQLPHSVLVPPSGIQKARAQLHSFPYQAESKLLFVLKQFNDDLAFTNFTVQNRDGQTKDIELLRPTAPREVATPSILPVIEKIRIMFSSLKLSDTRHSFAAEYFHETPITSESFEQIPPNLKGRSAMKMLTKYRTHHKHCARNMPCGSFVFPNFVKFIVLGSQNPTRTPMEVKFFLKESTMLI